MKNITDTGIRGYLKWLKDDQPGIYASIAPHLVTHVPDAFSDREQSMAMGHLMDVTSGAWHEGPDWSDRAAGSRYDWNNPASVASPWARGMLGDTTTGGWDTDWGHQVEHRMSGLGDDSTDVSDAANSGQSSSSITSIIGNLVSAAGQVFLAKNQVDTLNQVNQIQLQRAQAGLPPLNMSSLSLGIPQVQVGLNRQTLTGGGIALAGLAILGIWALSSRKGGSSARR